MSRWTRLLFGPVTRTIRKHQQRLGFESLEDRVTPDSAFSQVATLVNGQLATVEAGLGAIVQSTADVPVLGQPLGGLSSTAQSALSVLRARLRSEVALLDSTASPQTLDDVLTATLNNAGILADVAGNGTDDDVVVQRDANGRLTVQTNLGRTVTGPTVDVGLGLPGLPLILDSVTASTKASVTYRSLTFGLAANGSPFIDHSPANQLSIGIQASLASNAIITGTLGFMTFGTRANSTSSAAVSLSLLSDYSDQGFAPPRLTGDANVLIPVEAKFGGGDPNGFAYPGIQTDFQLHWNFLNSDPMANLSSFGSDPEVEFKNVKFGLGTYLSGVMKPVFDVAQGVMTPLEPILDILSARIPGLSDLAEKAGFGSVDLIKLAQLASATGAVPPEYQLLIELVSTLNGIHEAIDGIDTNAANYFINVGNFNLTGNDVRSATLNDIATARNLSDLIPFAFDTAQSVVRDVESQLPAATAPLFNLINNKLKTAQNRFSIDFPLLKNPTAGIFRLMLGQDVDFVSFTGQLHLDAYETELYPLVGPLSARLNGEVDVDAYFKLGYDTFGLRKLFQTGEAVKLASGFYLDATRPLLHMSGGISLGAALSAPMPPVLVPIPTPLGLIPVPIGPTFSVNGKLAVNDLDVRFGSTSDKFRIFETLPERIFLTKGTVTAGVNVVVEAGIPGIKTVKLYEGNGIVPDTVLLDLDNGPLANPVNVVTKPPVAPPKMKFELDMREATSLLGREANDGKPDRIELSVVRKNKNEPFTLIAKVNGKIFTSQKFPGTILLSQVESIRVLGSNDDDSLFVDGKINAPIEFLSGPGQNDLFLDDTFGLATASPARYQITPGWVQRTVSATETIRVTHDQGTQLTLVTNSSPTLNTVVIDEITNRTVNLLLGPTTHDITANLTVGGEGDRLNIARAVRRVGGTNSLHLIDDTGPPAVRFRSGPATYTLVDNSIRRVKPALAKTGYIQFERLIDAVATIQYDDMDTVEINGTDMGNTFIVQNSSKQVDYTLFGGVGDDVFQLGTPRVGIGGISKTISAISGGGNDKIVVDDSATAALGLSTRSKWTLDRDLLKVATDYVIPGTASTVSTSGQIFLTGIKDLTVKSGGSSTFTVLGTPTGRTLFEGAAVSVLDTVTVTHTHGPLEIRLPGAFAVVTVGGSPTGLNNIRGTIEIRGRNIGLTVDDAVTNVGHRYIVGANVVQRTDVPAITFFAEENLRSLALKAGSQRDEIIVTDTPITANPNGTPTSTTIQTNGGDDTVTVGKTTGSLDILAGGFSSLQVGDGSRGLGMIQGRVTITPVGSPSSMTLTLNDAGESAFQQTEISSPFNPALNTDSTLFQRSNAAPILFARSRPGRFQWVSGEGGNTVLVRARPGTSSGFRAGSGIDEFQIGSSAGLASNFGSLDLFGNTGTSSVLLNDIAETRVQTYNVATTLGRQMVSFRGTTATFYEETLGARIDQVFLVGGSGGNTIRVTGTGPTVDAMKIDAGVGDDTVRIGTDLGQLKAAIQVDAQTGQDQLFFDDLVAGRQDYAFTDAVFTRSNAQPVFYQNVELLDLKTSNGDDQIGYASVTGTLPATIRIDGRLGSNSLAIDNVASTIRMTNLNQGTVNTGMRFANVQTLLGSGFDDSFVFAPSGRLEGGVYGQAGNDTLDYSAWTANVIVNLRTNAATATTGIDSFENVVAGSGNDLLVGSGGNDLAGGAGRDVLIAGVSASTLTGGVGEDVLIGGSTVYDTDPNFLVNTWVGLGSLTTYAQRVAALFSGPNAPLYSSAVQSNGGGNQLSGDAARDLFFGSKSNDTHDWNAELGEVFVDLRKPIHVDASALSPSTILIDGVEYGTAGMEVDLAPGVHTLQTNGADVVYFEVAPNGLIDYDTSMEGILQGKGTTSLLVMGRQITVDAHLLSTTQLNFDGLVVHTFDPTIPNQSTFFLRLLPGEHKVTQIGGDTTLFYVTNAGLIEYHPQLEGALVGAGTSTLGLQGREITIDATFLDLPWIWVSYNLFQPVDGPIQVRLLPGIHYLILPEADEVIYFEVRPDGTIAYDPLREGILSGLGTTTLEVISQP